MRRWVDLHFVALIVPWPVMGGAWQTPAAGPKTVITEIELEHVEVPQGTDSSFDPVIVRSAVVPIYRRP